jgi:CrcB protein
LTRLVLIAVGAVLGALARYGLSGLVQRRLDSSFPGGTLVVNVVGCVVIGVILYLTEDRPMLRPEARLFLVVGVLGSFTTFSAFGYETFEMLRDGALRLALLNVLAQVVLGLGAVWGGHAVARAIGG